MRIITSLICLLAVGGVLGSSLVQADELGEVTLGAITVTAQKQEENVQNVPISISTFNEMDIEDRNIDSMSTLGDFVPNLMIFNNGIPGMNIPVMRGLSAFVESFKVSTGLYVDDVPLLNAIGFENGMLDIERIEVLRGPQGTLYGKGAEAGAINIISRQPDNDFQGAITGQAGQWLSSESGEKKRASLMLRLSGPILKDRLYYSLAGKIDYGDGFIKNSLTGEAVDDKKHWLGNARLRWTPTERLDVSLNISSLDYNDGANKLSLAPLGANVFQVAEPDYRQVASNMNGENWSEDLSASLKISYALNDSLLFSSITTNRTYQFNMATDFDYSPQTIFHTRRTDDYTKLSQELRVNYAGEGLKWLVGMYYEKEDNDIYIDMTSMSHFINDRTLQGETYAIFGNLTFSLTEKLGVNLGLRYERDDQEFELTTTGQRHDDSWDALTPKLALNYNITPNITTFASVSKGYRSGGYSGLESDPAYFTYGQEDLWAYEIGTKMVFFNKRLHVNGSAYYMDINDMQVEEKTTPQRSHTTNAAEATSKGFELEMTAQVTSAFSTHFSFGYNNTEFDRFSDVAGDYRGNKNPWSPDYTFSVGGQYRHPSGLYLRADIVGYGKVYFDQANQYSREPYEIVNAKIGYEGKHIDAYLYAKNLFDEDYSARGAFGGFYTIYSDPGEFGMQLTYRF